MGSVLSGVGAVAGGVPGMIGGQIFGGGGDLTDTLGVKDRFQSNPIYSPEYLREQVIHQNEIYAGQQQLAQALQAQMAGTGPNPAQTQYLANNQSNIANAQGLISGQRGLNPALAARLGSNVATKSNQEAALGSALMQQQQQLQATANLGTLYGQQQQGNIGHQQLYGQSYAGAQNANAAVSAGNTNRNAQLVGGLLNGAGSVGAAMLSHGGFVNGGQINTSGDSPSNDTVHTMLSPGEIVIPRSKAQDPEKAKEFIDHLLMNKSSDGSDYGEVLKARRKKAAK
jgi:hypothetical protein